MTRRALGYVGLAKPYRFERTLAALVALLLGAIAGATALFLSLTGRLSADSPREFYFLYLAVLLAVSFLLVPVPRPAAVPLSVAALEIGLGFGSAALHGLGISRAAVQPANALTLYRNFTWHPLLQTVPVPSRVRDWGR